MRFHILQTIYRKEMLELFRDRRSLISMIALPMLMIPLLMVVGTRVMSAIEAKSKADPKAKMVAVNVRNPSMIAALRNAGFTVFQRKDVRAAVENKDVMSGVEEVQGAASVQLRLLSDNSNPTSSAAGAQVQTALNEFKDETVKAQLRQSGISESVLVPFTVAKVNVASQRKMSGMIWGTMLGYLLLLMMFSGGMHPIIDMTTGEKERKTLESFLATPAGRGEIVLGKMLAGVTAILLTALLTLGSMTLSIRLNRLGSNPGFRDMFSTIPMDGRSVLMIALTLIPLGVFAASIMMAIAVFARGFKEAQSYLTPLLIFVIFPAFMGGMPGLEMTPALALIPIFNASQVIRSILLGEVQSIPFTVTMAANITYAAVAFVLAKRRFEDESVLFRT